MCNIQTIVPPLIRSYWLKLPHPPNDFGGNVGYLEFLIYTPLPKKIKSLDVLDIYNI